MTDNRKTILIRSPNWIGDAVVSTSILGPIRNFFKDSRIVMVTKKYVAPVFDNNPFIDDIVIFSGYKDGIAKIKGSIGIILPNSFSSALLFALAGVKRRIGYKSDMRALLLTDKIPMPSLKQERLVDNFKRIALHVIGSENTCNFVPGIFLREREIDNNIKQTKALHLKEKPVIIDPGAAYGPSKIWQVEKYARLIDYIKEQKKLPVVLLGSAASLSLTRRITAATRNKPIVLTGKLNLRESITAISGCRLFISTDTGAMHIAAAFGVSQIAIFGSSSPKWTGPLNTEALIVYENLPCSPCFKRICPLGTYECMKNITLKKVEHFVEKLL